MRVLHINATSHTGGAALAMLRLQKALEEKGHESKLLVGRSKFPEDPHVNLIWDQVSEFRTLTDSLISRLGNLIEKYYGLHPWSNHTNLRFVDTPLVNWADIIDLRNLFGGYFNLWGLPELSVRKPIVWRLPDLWALTGHCAYPYDCRRWITGCHHCPLFSEEGRLIVEPRATIKDGTRRVWRAKKSIYRKSQLHIIITTNWMREQVDQSILSNALSVTVISNGVDLDIYRPRSKEEARKSLDLPQDEVILLWGADSKGNYRKGYHLAVAALDRMQKSGLSTPMLLTMGGSNGWDQIEPLEKIRNLGYIRDPSQQALAYAAADAFLCTTLADAQPQTALESLACGTPIIAFDVGPMRDLAIDGKTGFLSKNATAEDLVDAINIFLSAEDLYPELRQNCRNEAVGKYDLTKQTDRYIKLYQSILGEREKSLREGSMPQE
jgi:glycosyltransferase involved in cell wall biosynthesis